MFIARRGVHELTTTILTADEVRDLVEKMLKSSGRRVDLSTPFVDAMLPDGSRLHVAIPDITRAHWSVNIRKFVVRATHLDDLVSLGTMTAQCAAFLDAAVSAGLNILVAGGTQAGKTTLLNCLTAAIPSGERVVTCEEVFELKVPLPDVVGMQCRQPSLEGTGEIKLRRLVKEALRMRPSRIVVGEVRQEECPRTSGHQVRRRREAADGVGSLQFRVGVARGHVRRSVRLARAHLEEGQARLFGPREFLALRPCPSRTWPEGVLPRLLPDPTCPEFVRSRSRSPSARNATCRAGAARSQDRP